MKRSPHRTLTITRAKGGGWSLSIHGALSDAVYPTKIAAVRAARALAREQGGVVTVRNANGGVGKTFTLGRSAMTKLNAVEGVVLGRAGQRVFSVLDRTSATPAERRALLRKDLDKLAVGLKRSAAVRRPPAKSARSAD